MSSSAFTDKTAKDADAFSSSSVQALRNKIWVYVPVVDPDILQQARQWVSTQNDRWYGDRSGNKREYTLIHSQTALAAYCSNEKVESKGLLKEVSKDDMLYVYCHSFTDAKTHQPTGKIGGDTYSLAQGRKGNKKVVKLSPEMLAKHLENEGLCLEHKKLKLFSCYSSEFVPELSIHMSKKWPELEIYGYVNETIPAGSNFHKIAGLTHSEGKLYAEGDAAILEQEEKGLFKAKLHRIGYKQGVRMSLPVSEQKIDASLEEKPTIVSEEQSLSENLSKISFNNK